MATVAIISGKGGSGKTSVALALAQIVAILDRRVLLIDFDTNTHGASYFFDSKDQGLEEWLLALLKFNELAAHSENLPPKLNLPPVFEKCIRPTNTEPPFDFLPSKTNFEKKDWDIDYVAKHVNDVYSRLSKLIAAPEQYDYVFFDCQAGVNELTAYALKLSTHAVIVTELDSISTKALKNIEFQFNHILPTKTKAVINKLFLKERASYDQLTTVLRGLDFLPPIPFDMDIRDAFARNEIPLRQGEASSFFSAMLRIVRELFPDLVTDAVAMTEKLKRIEFENYEVELAKIEKEKEEIEAEKAGLLDDINRLRYKSEQVRRLAIPVGILGLSSVPLIISMTDFNTLSLRTLSFWVAGGGVFLAYLWFGWDFFFTRRRRNIEEQEQRISEIDQNVKKMNDLKEKYTTLYLTERRKLSL